MSAAYFMRKKLREYDRWVRRKVQVFACAICGLSEPEPRYWRRLDYYRHLWKAHGREARRAR